MVDAYGVRNRAVRQLLIDYISHRVVAGMDYTTSVSLTRNLARNFWRLVEEINPDQADLRLDETTTNAWRARIDTVPTRTAPSGPAATSGRFSSQRSIRRYQRPNGETVALLVIAPSKTDRERVIPISGELLHVLAEVLRFLTRHGQPIPRVRRWNPYERQHTPALPFLFQPPNGPFPAVASPTWARALLIEACTGAASQHPELDGLVFTSHDFRRIFATDLVYNGLPIHIGAALLGHADLQTTAASSPCSTTTWSATTSST